MSVDYKLYIPPYVPIDFIKKFMGAAYGDQRMRKSLGYDADENTDLHKPSSKNNPWIIDYQPEVQTLDEIQGFYRIVTAILQSDPRKLANTYCIHIDHCALDSKYMGYKLLSGSSGASQLVGVHKLLHVVGGQLIYLDEGKKNSQYCITVDKGVLNKKFFQEIEEESYYVYQNFIANVAHITPADMIEMGRICYYPLDHTLLPEMQQYIDIINSKKEKEILNQVVNDNNAESKNLFKI